VVPESDPVVPGLVEAAPEELVPSGSEGPLAVGPVASAGRPLDDAAPEPVPSSGAEGPQLDAASHPPSMIATPQIPTDLISIV